MAVFFKKVIDMILPANDAKREKLKDSLAERKRSDLGKEFAVLQRALNKTNKSMLVIVDGFESSGKGGLLKDLTRELDPKNYEVSVFEKATEEENSHPYLYRFFMRAPYEGQISFFDRSFYYELLNNPNIEGKRLKHLIEDVSFMEEALVKDDTLIVKFFIHQAQEEMTQNIKTLEDDDYHQIKLSDNDYEQLNNYDTYKKHFEEVLTQTNKAKSPWHILYTDERKNNARKALNICIEALDTFLGEDSERLQKTLAETAIKPLDAVDMSLVLSDEEYDGQIKDLQNEAGNLLFEAYVKNKPIIVAYEGTDAAGKGGNIERLTRYMDPRGYDVATVSSPTKHELAHHYLWRFYRDFPTSGRLTIFDRSWYGRVLVERIEKITPEYRWKEAYSEINQMEHNLHHQGYLVLKYLLIINKDEQLERFTDRLEDPEKQHKLTGEDLRNREKFDEYKEAMNDMVNYTSTSEVPWTVISGMDKNYARIEVLKDFIKRVKVFLK